MQSQHDPSKYVTRRWEDNCFDAFRDCAIQEWKHDMDRTVARRGSMYGGNKLRTYARFKCEWQYEPYLSCITNRDKRVLESKLRVGICPLRIETGRYEVVNGHKGLLPEQRTCLCCNNGSIEDEFHFIMKCPMYTSLRTRLFRVVQNVFNVSDMQPVLSEEDSSVWFIKIMSSIETIVMRARSDFIWDAFNVREMILRN